MKDHTESVGEAGGTPHIPHIPHASDPKPAPSPVSSPVLSRGSRDQKRTHPRAVTYWLVTLGLVAAFYTMHGHEWLGSTQLHTVMEVAATLLAATVGVMALVRFYSRKDNTFLFIGAAFLGTAFLDGFHTVVTSAYFKAYMPSDLPHLIPWSWVASRMFLAVMMYLSFLAWKREDRLGIRGQVSEEMVYLFTGVFTVASFLFFVYMPLPRAYYDEFIFGRPEEFVPAFFFLLALVGYLKKGQWRDSAFEHWLVLSLIVGFLGQAMFMSSSSQLFDYEFDVAHLLKKVSYVCVLTGLLFNMFIVFRRESETSQRVSAVVENMVDGVITIDDRGVIQSANTATSEIFGYDVEEIIGRNVSVLVPEPDHSAHDSYINNFIRTGNAKIIGIGREVVGLRQDGRKFPLELSVAQIFAGSNRMFVGIVRDITERKRMDQMKSEFISTVSHELRTPLTSIRGSLGLLTGGAVGEIPEKARDMIRLAEKNSDRLITLVNDLLDMEKIESGKMVYHMDALDLSELVEQAIEANTGFAKEFGVHFELKENVPGVLVYADASRLNQVLANLFSNAAKFSPKGETVSVSVVRRNTGLRISVADRGPGIPKDFQDRIFERFSQADASDTRQKGGTGLGLNITKAIVEKHGGQIGFDSVEGAGATFFFDLPERVGEGNVKSEKKSWRNTKKRRILICEDDHYAADLLSLMLQNQGFETETVHTAAECKARLKRRSFDLVTVDIILPDQDGISLIQDLHEQDETRNLNVIVISIKASETRDELQAVSTGITDWLDKPVDRSRLKKAINKAMRNGANGRPKVLYVEDDHDLTKIVSTMIGDDVEMIIEPTYEGAVHLIRDKRFDLIIIDVGLPDGSGLDLLNVLKNTMNSLVPVVIFSGEEVNQNVAAQVEAAMVKSRSTNKELVDTIREMVSVE